MRYISMIFIIVLLSMAMVSRKFFSKYKGSGLFGPLAEMIIRKIERSFIFDQIKGSIRKGKSMNEVKSEEEARKSLREIILKTFYLLTALNILIFIFSFIPDGKKGGNIIKRPGPYENPVDYSIDINSSDKKERYNLKVYPRELSKEEFEKEAEKTYKSLNETIKGNNADLGNVKTGLDLPNMNDDETLYIRWESSDPEVISSSGKVDTKALESPVDVSLKAIIYDEHHDKEFEWVVRVIPYHSGHWAKDIEEDLKKEEEKSRDKDVLVLPEEINGMTISAGKNTEMSMVCKLFILGILFVGVYIYALIDKIRKKGIKRRDEMLNDYSFFVSSIVLKMGAGLSVRETFMSIYRDMYERKEKGGLFEELRYMINGLNAGMDEKKVYSDMSKAVGIPEYVRLMTLICRNLERGNSNLLSLLKKEEKDAFMERKNRARKKGEEAAEKLLMPMLILLVVVIGIVMFPALRNL